MGGAGWCVGVGTQRNMSEAVCCSDIMCVWAVQLHALKHVLDLFCFYSKQGISLMHSCI